MNLPTIFVPKFLSNWRKVSENKPTSRTVDVGVVHYSGESGYEKHGLMIAYRWLCEIHGTDVYTMTGLFELRTLGMVYVSDFTLYKDHPTPEQVEMLAESSMLYLLRKVFAE